jgi:hypothetical protein
MRRSGLRGDERIGTCSENKNATDSTDFAN